MRGYAEATPPSGVTAELLARGTVADAGRVHLAGISLKTRGPIDVATVHVTFQPGGTTGWHVHPGPALVTVKTSRCRWAPRPRWTHPPPAVARSGRRP